MLHTLLIGRNTVMNSKEYEIYKKIKQAIIQQKLRPNIQLVEKDIAESFGVSRTPVRNVLRRLAYERLVKIIENKGAFVSGSSMEEAKEVFEMRRIIEAKAVRKACQLHNKDQIIELRKMIDEENRMFKNADSYELVQILGDFHLKIADISGNSYFYQYLEDLISLTNVIVGIYGGDQKSCSHHLQIFNAIEKRDEEFAEKLVLDHLNEIESNLNFSEEQRILPLSEIFQHK